MNEVKKMQQELNNEFNDAMINNVQGLLPEEWKARINEMLPKILGLIKHGLTGTLKKLTEELGENKKMFVIMNVPTRDEKGELFYLPKFMSIETSQLAAFGLKVGEKPKVNYPLTAIVEKIQAYKDAQQLLADLSSGSLFNVTAPVQQEQSNKAESTTNSNQAETPAAAPVEPAAVVETPSVQPQA